MARWRTLTVVLVTCLYSSAGGRAQEEPLDPAYWAPAEALVFVGVSDLGELGKRFERTTFRKALDEPAIGTRGAGGADSTHGVLWAVATLRERIAAALDVPAPQLQNPFGRSAALFVVATPTENGLELEPVFVATVRDSALMRTYYEKAVARFRAACEEHETTTAAGGRIDSFLRQSPQPPATQPRDAPLRTDETAFSQEGRGLAQMLDRLRQELFASDSLPSRLALGLAGERLIVALRPETVRAVLTRSASASMAEQAEYRKIGASFAQTGPVRLLLNVPRMCDLLARQGGEDAKATLAMLGADGVRSLIGHLDFGGETYDSMFEGTLLMSGERRGLARVLSMPNRPWAPDADFTAAAVYLRASLSAGALVEELERMLRQVEPDAADELAAGLMFPLGDGSQPLDLRHELLEALGPPVELSVSVAPPGAAASPRVLLRVALRSREGLDRFLDAVATRAPAILVRREIAGQAVYGVPALGASLAWNNGELVAGTTTAVSESSGAGGATRPASAPARAKRLAELLPPETSLVLYLDWAALRGAGGAPPTGTAPSHPAPALGRWIAQAIAEAFEADASAAADRAAAVAPTSLTTMTTATDGVRITSYQLKPGLN